MIEQEYKIWLSNFKGDKLHAEKYFLAYKGAIRLSPDIYNFTIHNPELYQDLSKQLSELGRQVAYRQYAQRKREEQYDMSVFEKEPEINVNEIPF